MKVKDITKSLQEWAPLPFQESYDNSGLIVGDEEMPIKGCLISLDLTESVIEEALKNQMQYDHLSPSHCIQGH